MSLRLMSPQHGCKSKHNLSKTKKEKDLKQENE